MGSCWRGRRDGVYFIGTNLRRKDDDDEDTIEISGDDEDGDRAQQEEKATAGTSHEGTKGK